MNVILCYTPTSDSNHDDEDQCYERLQSIIAKCPGKHLPMLMRDLNAKVEMDNNGYEESTVQDNWKWIKEALT